MRLKRIGMIYCIPILLLGVAQSHGDETSAYERIAKGADFIRTMKPLPTGPQLDPHPSFVFNEGFKETLKEPSDQEFLAIFVDLNKKVFGSQVFSLREFGGAFFDYMSTDVMDQTIFVNPEFVKQVKGTLSAADSTAVLRFMLAHEMGHYIHESFALLSESKVGILGTKSFHNSVLDPPLVLQGVHGEIDAIGMYLLALAGFDDQIAFRIFDLVREVKWKAWQESDHGPGSWEAALEYAQPGEAERLKVMRRYSLSKEAHGK